MIHAAFGCYFTTNKRSVLAVLAKKKKSFDYNNLCYITFYVTQHTQTYTFHKDTWPENGKGKCFTTQK